MTCILFFKAVSTTFLDIPSDNPIASNIISTFFLLKISNGFLKKIFLLILNFLFLFMFLAEIAAILIFFPVLVSISFFLRFNSFNRKFPICPKPTIAIFTFFFIKILIYIRKICSIIICV